MKEKVQKVHMSIKDKALLKMSKKVINDFYSDANFAAIKKMVESDKAALKGIFAVPAPVPAPVAPVIKAAQPTSTAGLLKRNSAKPVEAPVVTVAAPVVTPASPALIEKFKELSFFDLHKEAQIQKAIVAKFPEAIVDDKQRAKYSEFVGAISSLETLVLSTVKSRGLTEVFNTKMRENKLIISIFKEKIEKTK